MSTQSKLTDFFGAQKKTDNAFRSTKKIVSNVSHSVVKESDSGQSAVPEVKTPKRKKEVTKDKSLKSSKRKKTPKSDVIIEFKSHKIETKNETIIVSEVKPESDLKTEKPLNVKEIKEKLRNCKNLPQLKKQLAAINGCEAEVKQFKQMKVRSPTKKVFRTPTKQNRSPSKLSPNRAILSNTPITPIIPHKSPQRVTPNKNSDSNQSYRRRLFDVFEDQTPSPQKSENTNKSLRGVEHISYLSDSPLRLVLPQKYKLLSDMFKAVDNMVYFDYKNHRTCTFDKLKNSVQQITGRNFDAKKLAQIHTLFPNAFKIKYELFSSILSNQKPSHQLVITPVYNINVDIRRNSSHLLERHQIFVNKLLDITKRHHKQYLNDLGITYEDRDLIRWNRKFPLDSVPDIEPNDNALPSQPKFGEESAEKFLNNARQQLGLPTTVTTDTTNLDNCNDNQTTDSTKTMTNKAPTYQDLLKQFRARDAAKKVQEMTRKPEVERQLSLLRSLPEIIRIIHSFFIGSKKRTVIHDELTIKISNSFSRSLTTVKARDHLTYLCQLLPHWIKVAEVRQQKYFSIDQNVYLSSLEDRIKTEVNRLQNS